MLFDCSLVFFLRCFPCLLVWARLRTFMSVRGLLACLLVCLPARLIACLVACSLFACLFACLFPCACLLCFALLCFAWLACACLACLLVGFIRWRSGWFVCFLLCNPARPSEAVCTLAEQIYAQPFPYSASAQTSRCLSLPWTFQQRATMHQHATREASFQRTKQLPGNVTQPNISAKQPHDNCQYEVTIRTNDPIVTWLCSRFANRGAMKRPREEEANAKYSGICGRWYLQPRRKAKASAERSPIKSSGHVRKTNLPNTF